MTRSTVATFGCGNRTVSHTDAEELREVGYHPGLSHNQPPLHSPTADEMMRRDSRCPSLSEPIILDSVGHHECRWIFSGRPVIKG
jgi:hypothetical protein